MDSRSFKAAKGLCTDTGATLYTIHFWLNVDPLEHIVVASSTAGAAQLDCLVCFGRVSLADFPNLKFEI